MSIVVTRRPPPAPCGCGGGHEHQRIPQIPIIFMLLPPIYWSRWCCLHRYRRFSCHGEIDTSYSKTSPSPSRIRERTIATDYGQAATSHFEMWSSLPQIPEDTIFVVRGRIATSRSTSPPKIPKDAIAFDSALTSLRPKSRNSTTQKSVKRTTYRRRGSQSSGGSSRASCFRERFSSSSSGSDSIIGANTEPPGISHKASKNPSSSFSHEMVVSLGISKTQREVRRLVNGFRTTGYRDSQRLSALGGSLLKLCSTSQRAEVVRRFTKGAARRA
ncbi:hypothetical protein FRB93_008848 [Tulasnella sp. JGI-2019a]|nr:hypothetical protein FRB93_008848 [Tulasnella sp. JGI-2019a]